MWKFLLAAMAALTIAGGTPSYAEEHEPGTADHETMGSERMGSEMMESEHMGLSGEDRGAFLDARIAALKAGLRLTPAQEANWPALEKAIRNFAQLRAERRQARREETEPKDMIERLQKHADDVSKMGAALKQLADAAAPLYSSLDDSQKHRFAILVHRLRPHVGGGEWDHEMEFHPNRGDRGPRDYDDREPRDHGDREPHDR